MNIGTIKLECLPDEQRNYLMSLPEGKSEIPVYYRDGAGGVFFVSDFVLTDNKLFEKTAPVGLYRGGALLKLLTKNGQVVLYDERYQWLRLVGGIARFTEGSDLTKTALREAVVEELVVLAENETVRLVPEGTNKLVGRSIPEWGITVERILETGSLSVFRHFFNDANRAFEVVVLWDISDWDGLAILHNEEWFKGGRTGFAPIVIDEKGTIVGMYDGRHGYAPLPVHKLHSTLEDCL